MVQNKPRRSPSSRAGPYTTNYDIPVHPQDKAQNFPGIVRGKPAKTPKAAKKEAARKPPAKTVSRKTLAKTAERIEHKKKEAIAVERVAETEEALAAKVGSERYWEAVGRRKTAVARVRLYTRGEKGLWINSKSLAEYFPYATLQRVAAEAVDTMNSRDRFRVSVKVSGGGVRAQAEAIRHGTARALVLFNTDFRKRLKRAGFLTRDPRMTERKKFGLKKARRAPQWAKR